MQDHFSLMTLSSPSVSAVLLISHNYCFSKGKNWKRSEVNWNNNNHHLLEMGEKKKKRATTKGTVGDVKKLEMSTSDMIQNKDGFYLGTFFWFSFYFSIFIQIFS